MLKHILAGAALAIFATGSAFAAPLTLDISPSNVYQQTQNSPCVIDDPSCHNPAGFGSSTLTPNTPAYTNFASPSYTVQQIRNLVGNTFSVGIDVNTTTHPQATEILDSFSLAINGSTAFSYTGPQQLNTNNNGNGYSDALISGFDLSNFAAGATAQFFVTYHGATDGREEFFLISSQTPPSSNVPEPGALALSVLGLVGLVARRRA